MFISSKIIPQKLRIPAICALCEQYHKDEGTVCNFCRHFFTKIQKKCAKCSLPLINPTPNSLCGKCLSNKVFYDKVYVNYIYEEPLKTLIHQFKYKDGIYLKNFFINLMLKNPEINHMHTECLIPIPIHIDKQKKRGFNQSALLAYGLAKKLKISVSHNYCQKVINTLPQAHLNLKDRIKNLKNSFTIQKPPFKHITLIDDLITTGTTVNEIAKQFKKQGIETVNIWCIARAI